MEIEEEFSEEEDELVGSRRRAERKGRGSGEKKLVDPEMRELIEQAAEGYAKKMREGDTLSHLK